MGVSSKEPLPATSHKLTIPFTHNTPTNHNNFSPLTPVFAPPHYQGSREPANCVLLPASQVCNSIRVHGSAPVVARSPPVDASS